MTERREHWDDDLIDSVIEAAPTEYILRWGKVTGPQVYGLIAAVEDWQAKQTTVWKGPAAVRADKAEAAIQQVREYLAAGRQERGWGHNDDFDAGWDQCANHIETLLGGAE